VTRIRQLQTLLGFNLDEIAVILRSEDRLAEIRRACLHEHTADAQRLDLARESVELQQDFRATRGKPSGRPSTASSPTPRPASPAHRTGPCG
jgi:DNA-binding transcriptional MerR regulator